MDPQQDMYNDYEEEEDDEYDEGEEEPFEGYEELDEEEQQQWQQDQQWQNEDQNQQWQQQPQQGQQWQQQDQQQWQEPEEQQFEEAPPMEPLADPDACLCAPGCTCDDCVKKDDEFGGEGDGIMCTCDPCECETPPGSREKSMTMIEEEEDEEEEIDDMQDGTPFQLDEFVRAKEFFMNTSTKSGISLYDHLSDVIRKLLDERAPTNPVDYIEEISMNVKRYRFQQPKDVLQDVFYISEPVLNNARYLNDNWKTYSQYYEEGREDPGEGFVAGNFANLLRLQYYIEQVDVGLPREEMFRLALAIKDLTATRPYITKARFWGKVFGLRKNYYVVEADLSEPGSGDADLWQPEEEPLEAAEPPPAGGGGDEEDAGESEEKAPGAQETFEKAGNAIVNANLLAPYAETSGLSPEEQAKQFPKTPTPPGGAPENNEWGGEGSNRVAPPPAVEVDSAVVEEDFAKWQGYREELMTNFPVPKPIEEEVEIPAEPEGTGINRRAFYICNYLGQPWILLPPSTPKLVNGCRKIRWSLTGELEGKIRSVPQFQGKEGHFLKALLQRASAGSLVSPKGFYRGNMYPSEFDGEEDDYLDEEEEGGNDPGEDAVIAVKKYRPPMDALINPELTYWVHHACIILPQGRNVWWNPLRSKGKKGDGEDEGEDEDEGEFEGEDADTPVREVGPPLFSPISKDEAADGRAPWTLIKSSSVFKEFQILSVRSNTWPGSNVICTIKGKVDNVYLGDGQKFLERCYAPFMAEPIMREYVMGPEMREEYPDPDVEAEQKYLTSLEAAEAAKNQPRFVDNDEDEMEGEDEGTEDEN